MGSLRRRRRPVRCGLAAPTVADAVAALQQRREQDRSLVLPRVRLRVRSDGRLRARVFSSFRATPVLKARIRPGDDGAVLDGEIREARAEIYTSRLFTSLTILCAGIAVVVAVTGSLAAVKILSIPIVLFAFGAILPRWKRASMFDSECQELLDGLAWLMRPDRPEPARARPHVP